MSITIKQIAELAGVSRSAVDKVLHNRPGISPEVRERVTRIATEHHYVPNQFARALSAIRNPLIFAIIIPNPNRAVFFKMLKNGMNAAAQPLKAYGVSLEFYYTDGFNEENIKPVLSYLKKKEVHGIAIRFKDDDLIQQAIDSLTEEGVTVITFDSDIPNSKRLCFVGEDNYQIGKMAAELLAKCTNSEGKVAMITGSNQIRAHQLRAKGFKEALSEVYPRMTPLDPIETLEQDIIEYQETKKLLSEHPDITGIFIVAGRLKKIIQAIEESGIQKKISIVVCDYIQESSPYVKRGIVDFAIGLSPFQEGCIVIETLFEAVHNSKKDIEPFIKTPASIYIKENIEEFDDVSLTKREEPIKHATDSLQH